MYFAKIALFSFVAPFLGAPVLSFSQTNSLELATEESLPISGLPSVWLQGDPVTKWEQGRVYVFEFWATWCGPCIQAMPHVEAIHEQIKASGLNAQVVGVNVFDRVPAEKLKNFLKQQRVQVSYTMGADLEGSRTTQKKWLEPLNVNGIPHSIVVKDGKILWRGHPKTLSFEMVQKMAQKDFSADSLKVEEKKQINERTWADKELARIRKLFANSYDDKSLVEAIKARNAYLEDSRSSPSQKISSFSDVANIFYARGNYKAFMEELMALSTLFPSNRAAQREVITCILDSDEFPTRGDALKIAERAANRLISLDAAENKFQAKPYELLSKILVAESQAAGTGENAKSLYASAIAAQEQAVKYSASNKLLEQIREKVGSDCKAKFDENILKEKIPEPQYKISGDTIPSKTTGAEKLSRLLKSLSWAQGSAPATLPANKTVFLEIWNPPMGNGIISGMLRDAKPARWFGEKAKKLPGVEVYVLVPAAGDSVNLKTLREALNKPYFKTEFPVGIIRSKLLFEKLMTPNGLTCTPAGFALRDGEVIWAGNPQDAPEWLFETALDGEYSNELGKIVRECEADSRKTLSQIYKKIRTHYENKEFEKGEKLLEQWLPEFKKSPGLASISYELLMGECLSKKDFPGVVKLSNELLDLFPDNDFIGNRQYKILTSNPELKEISLPVIEKALIQMIRTHAGNPYYISACLRIIAELNLTHGNKEKALGAAETALKTAPETETLNKLKAHNE